MKRIFALILLVTLLSCDKDEPTTLSAKYSKEQIFNAVVGTWKFNRLAYDADFKKIRKIEVKECAENNRTILRNDGSITCSAEGCGKYSSDETGTFSIRIGGLSHKAPDDIYIEREKSGMYLLPEVAFKAWTPLHSFTDSTLIISDVRLESDKGPEFDEYNLFSELKRVKE